MDPSHPVSLNPFAQGLKVLNQIAQLDQVAQARFKEKTSESLLANTSEESPEDEGRDILGEILIAAFVMITGVKKKKKHGFGDRIECSSWMRLLKRLL
jgi:hypothetical protein